MVGLKIMHQKPYFAVFVLAFSIISSASGCAWLSDDEPQPLPPFEPSPGFFSDFDHVISATFERVPANEQADSLRLEYGRFLVQGPGEDELYAVGETWNKVSALMELGVLTSDVLRDTQADANRTRMFVEAADMIRLADIVAVEAWNSQVIQLGRQDASLSPTPDLVLASAELVLNQAEYAVVQVWVESGEWVEGYWTRTEGYYEEIWIPGYYEAVWQEGYCYDEYIGTDCDTYWVEGSCYDVWVDDGYWDEYCSYYDEWGTCLAWDYVWVDLGYWEYICDDGYWWEDCYDLYETVCVEGQWVEIWIDGYYTQGPWIPGETYWVEGYWSDTSSYQPMVLVDLELDILSVGAEYLLGLGQDRLGAECSSGLEAALNGEAESPIETRTQNLRDALLFCLEL